MFQSLRFPLIFALELFEIVLGSLILNFNG